MLKNNSLFDLSNQVTVVTGGGGVLCAEMCIAFPSVGCLAGTILSCQVYGKYFSKVRKGNIINIASINAIRPLTRIPAYSAAKAAVGNFTQWLAVHKAQEYSPEIRVNAIVPGFFLTKHNRYLIKNEATDG